MKKISYSSAVIEFLNRDKQEVKAMAYPISKITLNNFDGKKVIPFKTFTVKKGNWVEVENPD
jgi:hypothetical protein